MLLTTAIGPQAMEGGGGFLQIIDGDRTGSQISRHSRFCQPDSVKIPCPPKPCSAAMKITNIAQAGLLSCLILLPLCHARAEEAPGTVLVQPAAVYPLESRRRGEAGAAVVRFVVDETGLVSSTEILTSSGYPRLDSAAVEAVQKARFTPFRRQGQPVAMTFVRAVRFELNDAGSPVQRAAPPSAFASNFEVRVAFAKSSIRKFSATPGTEAQLSTACFEGIRQWLGKSPDMPMPIAQRLAALEPRTPLELQRFVDSVDENALSTELRTDFTDSCVAGMVRSLDRDSYLYSKKDLGLIARYNRDRWGEIWLQTEYEHGLPTIKYLPPDANAYSAGLRVGDRIEMIDGQPLAADDRGQFRRLVRGPVGSKATLSVSRANEAVSHSVSVERQIPLRRGVRSQRISQDVLYLGATRTDDASLGEMVRAIQKAGEEAKPVRGVILDLRNNPGDALPSVVAMAAAFVGPDTQLGQVRRNEHEVTVQLAAAPYFYRRGKAPDPLQGLPAWIKNVPLAVLVNNATSGGAEFVAAALQDQQRAVVIGQHTGAHALVRMNISDTDGAMLVLTSGYLYRQGNRPIDGAGVEPDIVIAAEQKQGLEAGLDKDPLVSAAIHALRQRKDGTSIDEVENNTH